MLSDFPPGVYADQAADAAEYKAPKKVEAEHIAQIPKRITADRRAGEDAEFIHEQITWRRSEASANSNTVVQLSSFVFGPVLSPLLIQAMTLNFDHEDTLTSVE
jgi:hypothetical protein